MNRQLTLFTISAAILILVGLTLYSTAFSHRSLAQEGKKSLDIRRHPAEPLELVDVTVAERSLKANIKVKSRLKDKPAQGLDTVDFDSKDDWLKKLKFKVRNISNKTILGFSASLYFDPGDAHMMFSATLVGSSGPLEGAVLAPGEQIDVLVDEGSLNRTIMRLRAYGADPSEATVSLAIEMVAFSDGIMWRKGRLIKKDPANPNRWIPARSQSPPGLSRFNHGPRALDIDEHSSRRARGKNISSILTPRSPQLLPRCVLDNDTGQYAQCAAEGCFTIFELGGGPGTSSIRRFTSDCKQLPGPVVHPWTCTGQTTHELLEDDPTCDDPPPTPTPGCVGIGEIYYPFGWPCCAGLTPSNGTCATPEPTPSPSVTPPPCPGGIVVQVPPPWFYQCLPNPFANPFASPSPSPSSTPLPIGWFCFADAHCQSGYCLNYRCATPTPTPTPIPTPTHGYAGCSPEAWDVCMQVGAAGCHDGNCYTPILIDPLGDGFSLSSAGNGVVFNLIPGLPVKVAWTTPDSDDAWLVLDRNRNGSIDSGHELFGNSTSQSQPPPGVEKNGFLALAEFDKAVNGGNGDRAIDKDDAVFSLLRLWQDTNHNGISEPGELHLLTQFGLESIALDYRDGRRRDRHGNVFRYRAKVYGPKHNDLGRWAYDVLLRMEPLKSTDTENRYARASTDGGNNILRLFGIEFGYDLTRRSWLRRAENP